jgi:serine/threonine-protein kinase
MKGGVEKLASYVVRSGRLPRRDAVGWVVRICISMEVLHAAGSPHGRISAKAIDVLGPMCEAGGFFLDHGELTDDVAYQSPERVKGKGPSLEDDVWACGVLLYNLLTGALPFTDERAARLRALARACDRAEARQAQSAGVPGRRQRR